MKKSGRLLLVFIMFLTLMGCSSQAKITDEEKELVESIEMTSNSKKAFQEMMVMNYNMMIKFKPYL